MTIDEVLDGLKVEYLRTGHHHCRPGWIQLRHCPFCQSANFHLGYNLASNFFYCWRCRYHHPSKVLAVLGVPRDDARKLLRSVEPEFVESRERSRASALEPAGRGPFLPVHRRYLKSRGFDPEEISRLWNVEGIGIAKRLSWRLYIPIIHRGARVSWTTRAVGERVQQRYVSASAEEESVNHKSLVYGSDFCHQSIVIVEGPTDAWRIGPGAGALFGTAFTPSQVKRLIKFPYRFICFDSSLEAQRNAQELGGQLSVFPGVTQNILMDAKDPGSASDKEVRSIRKVAKL